MTRGLPIRGYENKTFSWACGAREAGFFVMINFFFAVINDLFLWSEGLNSRFVVVYVVNIKHFHAPRACVACEAVIFFHDEFFLA